MKTPQLFLLLIGLISAVQGYWLSDIRRTLLL